MTVPHVAILTKAPLPGRCKSRLAVSMGEEAAAQFARISLETIFARLRSLGIPFHLHPVDEQDRHWFVQNYPSLALGPLQIDGDLGDKMSTVIDSWLAEYSVSVVIGSDAPDAPFADLNAALDEDPAVRIGPAGDGGFWCLGSRGPLGRILEGIPWSSGREQEATVRALREDHRSITFVGQGEDVDTEADLHALALRLDGRKEAWASELAVSIARLRSN